MRAEEVVCEIEVCIDCMLLHANGEFDPDRSADEPIPLSKIGFGYSVAMGGSHVTECVANGDNDADCDCDHIEFSWTRCDGCGSNLGGSRYRFTLFRATVSHALNMHRSLMEWAATCRRNGDSRNAIESLATAALWRAYLADRFAVARGETRLINR